MTTGCRFFCKEFLCFNTMPLCPVVLCRPMPLLVYFWGSPGWRRRCRRPRWRGRGQRRGRGPSRPGRGAERAIYESDRYICCHIYIYIVYMYTSERVIRESDIWHMYISYRSALAGDDVCEAAARTIKAMVPSTDRSALEGSLRDDTSRIWNTGCTPSDDDWYLGRQTPKPHPRVGTHTHRHAGT